MVHKIKIPVLLGVLLTFFIFSGFPLISIPAEKTTGKKEIKNPYAKAKIRTKIIPSANKTFGYEVLANGKTLVRQPSIPAMPGNEVLPPRKKRKKLPILSWKKSEETRCHPQ